MRRPGWLGMLVGVTLGLAAGLYYAWAINPVAYMETAPASLRADFRADYLTLIAVAYAADGDLPRARARLGLFADANPAVTLAALAQQRLGSGAPPSEARALALLAGALGERPTPLADTAGSSTQRVTPFPTRTATPTATPRPTRTPTAAPGAPYALVSREQVCDPALAPPQLMVVVEDAAGRGVAGVEVLVLWDSGQSRFFTGLKPELGLGYADFAMQSGVSYALQLSYSEELIPNLTAADCVAPDDSPYAGSVRLRFAQP